MEAVGAVKFLEKSVADLQLRFTTYIGDGDSKAYPAIIASNPYGTEKPVNKGECFGRVQKRVGGRLRKLEKKKLGGGKRLNEKAINKLQNYYWLAIRQNTDSLIKMRKAVCAVLYHCSEASSAETRHVLRRGFALVQVSNGRNYLRQCEMKLCPYFRNFHPKCF